MDDIRDETLSRHGPYGAFGEVLSRWAERHPTPLVLLIDEIDALVGDTLRLNRVPPFAKGGEEKPAPESGSPPVCKPGISWAMCSIAW